MTKFSPDIHENPPEYKIAINKAGIEGLKKKIKIKIGNSCSEKLCTINLYIDLDKELRGVHLSRLVNSLNQELNSNECFKLNDLLEKTAKRVLNTHFSSSRSEIHVSFEDIIEDTRFVLHASYVREKNGSQEGKVSIELNGITSCPCAKEVFKFYENTEYEKTPTHMQRAELHITLNSKYNLDLLYNEYLLKAISVGKSSFSDILKETLNRDEEYEFIKKTINNPMFAEDVCRKAYFYLKKELPSDIGLKIKVISYESIHPYNVIAEVSDLEEHRY
ncbi:GTP cyclohydrolase I FolE2 [Fervidicoccus fontis]|uniref:Regulatory protein n=1 Tax=Fervidicoccus fontis (strain DSM 19380 / JCM 18336 / VKM B-2539 / Kam940) TaxID=1163730 RepID=I0A069_FERFK|nr:GTP cyclohydrolase I FolE2 [Fervidicoccus fontis]AFH42376.1 regulatory protein [Fervidicoccus fontis Kam940]